jgi:hypothetical protein
MKISPTTKYYFKITIIKLKQCGQFSFNKRQGKGVGGSQRGMGAGKGNKN